MNVQYLPYKLYAQDIFTLAQLSDLHLTGTIGTSPSYQRFLQALHMVKMVQPDLLVLTGDLVNHGKTEGYDWLFDTLLKTNIAFACIGGNHDVTHETNEHLPFEQRQFFGVKTDIRLLNQHSITVYLNHHTWQILLIHSGVSGQIAGQIDLPTLTWLDQTLANHLSTVIALHHHPITVGSAWIDAYQLQNHAEFWHIINKHPNVHAIICGHVHQAHSIIAPTQHLCTVHTCPATDRQFMPYQKTFTLDNQQGGLRILQLSNDNTIATHTKRYDVHLK